ncbi:MAG TPA: hypothetical protein VMT24_06115 [Aggregatilineaceae bacterium]|nr:hypothetical protein [Aggregatilineaceae bacterium]
MDRTVPKTGSEEIALYVRTYYSLLRSTHAVQLDALVETHLAMNSSMHQAAGQPTPDASALHYAVNRLPACIADVDLVVMGQTDRVFREHGYTDIEAWEPVVAPARRRRMAYDRKASLAAYIASRSDIDDLIPTLVCYQIEWNKLHGMLQSVAVQASLAAYSADSTLARTADLARALGMSADDLSRLQNAWGKAMISTLWKIAEAPKRFSVRLLAGTYINYQRATSDWWYNVRESVKPVTLQDRPVYFVSSNIHAIPNLLSGFALREEQPIFEFVERAGDPGLKAEYDYVRLRDELNNKNNFLYYALRRYAGLPDVEMRRVASEHEIGITRVPSLHGFDIEAQVIELSKLDPARMDPRVMCCTEEDLALLSHSDALIVNIDYPLGMAAYHVMAKISQYCEHMRGIYVVGKAATLNARMGDVLIANVVYDEHSENSYLFGNCFTAADVIPYLTLNSVLDNQKIVSVRGTFLQNAQYMDVFYREGYSVVEMEAGPYLSAVYEMVRAQRHPVNEIVNLYIAPFDIGFLHYASDTPRARERTLGAGSLSYLGAESTYATAIAALRRICSRELARLRAQERSGQALPLDTVEEMRPGANGGSL